jgi:hypothetical protein
MADLLSAAIDWFCGNLAVASGTINAAFANKPGCIPVFPLKAEDRHGRNDSESDEL